MEYNIFSFSLFFFVSQKSVCGTCQHRVLSQIKPLNIHSFSRIFFQNLHSIYLFSEFCTVHSLFQNFCVGDARPHNSQKSVSVCVCPVCVPILFEFCLIENRKKKTRVCFACLSCCFLFLFFFFARLWRACLATVVSCKWKCQQL